MISVRWRVKEFKMALQLYILHPTKRTVHVSAVIVQEPLFILVKWYGHRFVMIVVLYLKEKIFFRPDMYQIAIQYRPITTHTSHVSPWCWK